MILATNVAETSITVPGVRAVIDSGLVRIARYSARARVERLPIEQVSQASATQRAGRCGRVGPGTCIRLYSEETFTSSEPFTQPEILRSNLASVILRMLSLGLGEIDSFPFLERPPGRMVQEGWETLYELGAIDRSHRLTEIGTCPCAPAGRPSHRDACWSHRSRNTVLRRSSSLRPCFQSRIRVFARSAARRRQTSRTRPGVMRRATSSGCCSFGTTTESELGRARLLRDAPLVPRALYLLDQDA